MSKSQTLGLWRRLIKNRLDIMMSRHNEVKIDLTYEGHQNTSKTHFMDILGCFDDLEM